MAATEYVTLTASVVAIAVAIGGIWQARRKPALDEAQAEHALVNSQSVKATIKKMSDETNARRDIRLLELEAWGDDVRAWARQAQDRLELHDELLRQELWDRGAKMPDLPPLPPFPAMPPPRPV